MPRVIIIAGGDRPTLTKDFFQSEDVIIAADKGAQYALELGVIPALVVGDFDSINSNFFARLESLAVPIERHQTAKDQTDLELAIERGLSFKPSEIILIGALGGRLDHLLANVMILANPLQSQVKASIQDGSMEAHRLMPSVAHAMTTKPGDIISLIPISSSVKGVTLTGTRWPLQGATLSRGSSLTVSNEALETTVTAYFEQGQLLIIRYAASC